MFSGYEDNYILPFGCQKDFLIILGGIMIHYSSVQGQGNESVPKSLSKLPLHSNVDQ